MIHIAMLIPTIDQIGGAERQVLLLACKLAARGHRVTVLVLSGSRSAPAELSGTGIEYLSLEMRKAWIDPRGWLRYLRWYRCNRPEILHAHLPHATWFARAIRPLAPVRVLVDTIHTSHTGSRARQLGYRLSSFLGSHITGVSAAVAGAALDAHMAFPKNLSIVPNGIALPEEWPNRSPDSAPATFQWIAVGRLAAVKDYPTLLRAFAGLPGGPGLTILGSGAEKYSLHRLAIQLGIENRVLFAGFERDIQSYLAAADAFVLTSLWEGLPIAVLEASAAGLPIVATGGAGTREAMIPGQTGFLAPVGDVAAIRQAMLQLMMLPEPQRQAIGSRGRQFVERHFSIAHVADRWEKLYASLLEANPRPLRRG